MATAVGSEGVPVVSDLKQIYGEAAVDLDKAEARFQNLAKKFEEVYGEKPELVARAPGRVNLIGEHIDYEGYSVLPMAIKPDTLVAVRHHPASSSSSSSPALLRIANVKSSKYPPAQLKADPSQDVDVVSHHWANYFLCGFKGVSDYLTDKGLSNPLQPGTVGFDLLVDGAVPVGGGLSSSAALVCASVVAVMAALGHSFPKVDVADLACRCERYIGTQSGGMDQAISILARPGVAKHIEFNPVRASDVPLPAGSSFVIANSLAVSQKAVTAATNYNRRVVECRLAAMVLAVKLGMPPTEAVLSVHTLSDVEPQSTAYSAPHSASGPLPAVKALLHLEPYGREELEGILQAPLGTVFAASNSSLSVLAAASSFMLRQRAEHVYSETQRVHQFRGLCSHSHQGPSPGSVLTQLGLLMNQSHASCSELYECSSPELEELVGVCRRGGAYGARLTGAGWGGCVVSLVSHTQAPAFVDFLKAEFYAQRIKAGIVGESELESCVFASTPSGGAAIYSPTQ